MKHITVIYEGAADVPLDELEGRTPLQVARCVHAHALAESGRTGLLMPVQDGLDGRDEALLGVLFGLQTDEALALRRGPLEALSLAQDLDGWAYAYRGNFVTLDAETLTDGLVSGLSTEETRALADELQVLWNPDDVRLEVLGPGRVVVLLREAGARAPSGYPPCLMEGERYETFLPAGKEGEWIRTLVKQAAGRLGAHMVNEVRVDLGENPANGLWLWGGGPTIAANSIKSPVSTGGIVLSQSLMAHGLARACGMDIVSLEPSWQESPAQAAFKVGPLVTGLQQADFVAVYIEAPHELSRYGNVANKIRALERMDQCVLGPLVSVLDAYRPYRLVLTASGVVSSRDQHPTSGNVPLVVVGDGISADETKHWDEQACVAGMLSTAKPAQVMDLLRRA